jgi:tetratricopeptide (TPR) repeat protein
MQYRLALVPLLLSAFVPCMQAQLRGGAPGMGTSSGNVHIHVVYENDRQAGPNLLVKLMDGSSSTPVATTWTNGVGQADFRSIALGQYHVEITGFEIQPAASELFEVDQRKVTQAQYVVVHRLEDTGPKPVDSKSSMVAASDLNAPPKARKEVDKANESMLLQDYKKALEHLNKALELDPQYATAYNNLGVLYARMNDMTHEHEALEKAVSLDSHFAPALENLGKLCLREKKFPEAESNLEKAVGSNPGDAEGLMLLANAQYMNQHYDSAISSARRAHAAGHEHPSFVHYIAARAYQHENRQQDAISEFQLFLKEEPKGPRADHVRGDLAKIDSAQRSAQ